MPVDEENEHLDYDSKFKLRPVEVFNFSMNPYIVMTTCTALSIILYFIFMFVGLNLGIDYDTVDGVPSVSAIIAYSKAMTLTFTFIVYIHSYSLYSYLIILSQYLGKTSFSFISIVLLCVLYILSLIIVTYLPLNVDEFKHNVFAVSAFVFAALSVYLHKHSLLVYTIRGYEFCNQKEGVLIVSELLVLITITVMAGLFWFQNNMWAEYMFILIILIDKQIKIWILLGTELIYLKGSYISYSYYSPPNPLDPNFVSTDYNY